MESNKNFIDGSTSHLFFSFVSDPCLVHYCTKGRECAVENGKATCVCQRQCAVHRRLVCGSDGHVYPNHCELHRASCMTATAITVERGVHCIKHGKLFFILD